MTKYFYHTKLMHEHVRTPGRMVYDRSKTLPQSELLETITPIGELVTPRSIEDVCVERAAEIARIAREQNKKVYLYWSGGLDATAAFYALRDALSSDELVIVMNNDSILEYRKCYNEDIAGRYKVVWYNEYLPWRSMNQAFVDGIVVTGECGDNIFGSYMYFKKTPAELAAPWRDGMSSEQIAAYEPFVAACPSEIVTAADLYWWRGYATRYQHNQCWMLLDNKEAVINQNVFHFYDSKAFNDYSVSTPTEEKIPGFEAMKFKMPLRQFILSRNGDQEYFATKSKGYSFKIAKTPGITFDYIDTSWAKGFAQ